MKKTGLLYPAVFVAFFVLVVVTASPSLADDPLAISSVGAYSPPGAPEGLSGLTYAGGNQYYAANDSGGLLQPVTININFDTGGISSASFGSLIHFGGTDLEGIAYDPYGNSGAGSIYVSDESGATIKEYSMTGTYLSSVSVPSVYLNYETNRSLESLTLSGNTMWTSNEEDLTVDDSTVVRLQKFTRANPGSTWVAAGQYAYTIPGTNEHGLSDLCVLPNGKLLALERRRNSLSTDSHIFEIDTTNATDVTNIAALTGTALDQVQVVTKHELWDESFGGFNLNNFEGLCLGQELGNGDYSLLMISDGDNTPGEDLYALRISGGIPEPATLSLLAIGGLALIRRRKRSL